MTVEQKISKFYFILNYPIRIYMLLLSIFTFVFLLYCWTNPSHNISDWSYDPNPTLRNKVFSLIYLVVIIYYWVLIIQQPKNWKDVVISKRKLIVFWVKSLVINLSVFILSVELAGFPNILSGSKEELALGIIYLPLIPFSICCIGILVNLINNKKEQTED